MIAPVGFKNSSFPVSFKEFPSMLTANQTPLPAIFKGDDFAAAIDKVLAPYVDADGNVSSSDLARLGEGWNGELTLGKQDKYNAVALREAIKSNLDRKVGVYTGGCEPELIRNDPGNGEVDGAYELEFTKNGKTYQLFRLTEKTQPKNYPIEPC